MARWGDPGSGHEEPEPDVLRYHLLAKDGGID